MFESSFKLYISLSLGLFAFVSSKDANYAVIILLLYYFYQYLVMLLSCRNICSSFLECRSLIILRKELGKCWQLKVSKSSDLF